MNDDKKEVWQIISPIVKQGTTYVFYPDSSEAKMLNYWFQSGHRVYVACADNRILGTFYLRPNQPDLGSHVANAAYMVAPAARGRGIGKAMALYSMDVARELGYDALQFNFVLASNAGAIRLWKALGFEEVGCIPKAYRQSDGVYIDALVFHRFLH